MSGADFEYKVHVVAFLLHRIGKAFVLGSGFATSGLSS
jgi:hypothetical protein